MPRTDKQLAAEIRERFHDADEAREYLEKLRWPDGPYCPHCGSLAAYKLTAKPDSKRPVRKGVYKCKDCRNQYTVTVGTIFEDSHIPLQKWLMAIYLMCASKKGMSAHQLHRMLGLSYKAAWFMCHRIRYAMEQPPLQQKMTGNVEVDECYMGARRPRHAVGKKGRPGPDRPERPPVVALVERGGRVRSFHMKRITSENLRTALGACIAPRARVHTDEFPVYRNVVRDIGATHETVNHGEKEYVRGDVTTNTVEGFFGLLKRGVYGTFHHVSDVHLHRYLSEFDFRYNSREMSDGERTHVAVRAVEGKRLKYRDSSGGATKKDSQP